MWDIKIEKCDIFSDKTVKQIKPIHLNGDKKQTHLISTRDNDKPIYFITVKENKITLKAELLRGFFKPSNEELIIQQVVVGTYYLNKNSNYNEIVEEGLKKCAEMFV